MQIIFEAHATTLDNEANICSGWNDVALSSKGEQQAKELGQRYNIEEIDAVFCADLKRHHNTVELAFPTIGTDKLFVDWRLRECDYGDMTLSPKVELETVKEMYVTEPFPNGESYTDTLRRMNSFIEDLKLNDFENVLIVGSRATHYGLDNIINGISLEDCVKTTFAWQPGWKYILE